MIRIDEVGDRLALKVPELTGRIGTAGGFARMVERNQLPQFTPAAFVLPGGFRGGAADAVTGLFRQSFSEVVGVVLVVRVAADPLDAKGIDEISPLVRKAVAAIAGWAPDDAIGVFEIVQGELVGATGGVLVFQIDFSLNDQLRIPAL